MGIDTGVPFVQIIPFPYGTCIYILYERVPQTSLLIILLLLV
jgi:hypothetical protein